MEFKARGGVEEMLIEYNDQGGVVLGWSNGQELTRGDMAKVGIMIRLLLIYYLDISSITLEIQQRV